MNFLTNHFTARIAAIGLAVALCNPIEAQTPSTCLTSRTKRWVNPDPAIGDDTNTGAMLCPYRTLDKALDVARADPSVRKIYIYFSAYAIAPFEIGHNFGDPIGTGQEPADAFPLIVPDGVQIIGIPGPGENERPRITINESDGAGGVFEYLWAGLPSSYTGTQRRPMMILGDGCVLSNLEIDGGGYRHKDEFELIAVHAVDAQDVLIDNCVIKDTFDGVVFEETGADGGGASVNGLVTSGRVINSTLAKCFPGFAPKPLPEPNTEERVRLIHDRGHAALRLVVSGDGIPAVPGVSSAVRATVDVDVEDSIFELNHDAIETETEPHPAPNPCPDPPAPCLPIPLTDTDIQLHTISSLFQRNETGIEAVTGGIGNPCNVLVENCAFLEHYNRPACIGGYQCSTTGTGGAETTAAISQRFKAETLIVRNSVFRNNAIGIHAGVAAALIDLGEQQAGNNAFLVDPEFPFPLPDLPGPGDCLNPSLSLSNEPARVVMLLMEHGERVPASGNRWIASNQCTDANGCMANSTDPTCTACDFVTMCGDTNYPPPPTGLGFGSGALRNFSLSGSGSRLYFGPNCPPACTEALPPPCLFNAPVVEGNPLFPSCP